MLIRSSMKVVKVSSIQFASFLVPILLSVLADAYFLSDDSSYYDDESLSEEINEVETQDTQGTQGSQGGQATQVTQGIQGTPGTHGTHRTRTNYKNPSYSYEYKVNDPRTGDYKTQFEEKIGDVVRGSYSLIDPDGTRRIVEYTADSEHGFNAIVKKEPLTDYFEDQPPFSAFTPLPDIEPTPLEYARPVLLTPPPEVVQYPKKIIAYVPQSYALYPQKSKLKSKLKSKPTFSDFVKTLPILKYIL